MVKQLTGGIGADYVVECAGTEATINQAIHMTNRGGKICLAAFPHDPVTMDLAYLVKNNIYAYGIRGEGRSATRRAMALMAEKRFDATKIHTHTFPLADLPTALRYARERVEDAIKVVVTNRQAGAIATAAAGVDETCCLSPGEKHGPCQRRCAGRCVKIGSDALAQRSCAAKAMCRLNPALRRAGRRAAASFPTSSIEGNQVVNLRGPAPT